MQFFDRSRFRMKGYCVSTWSPPSFRPTQTARVYAKPPPLTVFSTSESTRSCEQGAQTSRKRSSVVSSSELSAILAQLTAIGVDRDEPRELMTWAWSLQKPHEAFAPFLRGKSKLQRSFKHFLSSSVDSYTMKTRRELAPAPHLQARRP